MSKLNDLVIFTDGSCEGNGKSTAVGGIGVYFPNHELKNISKIFRHGYCTNQKTELYAILTALRYIKKYLKMEKYRIFIKTDSLYSINCITKWVNGWISNGWKTKKGDSVANKEYISAINDFYSNSKYKILFEHVESHTNGEDSNSIGNSIADKLATTATKRAKIELKNGIEKNIDKINVKKTTTKIKPQLHKNKFNSIQSGNIIVELVKSKK